MAAWKRRAAQRRNPARTTDNHEAKRSLDKQDILERVAFYRDAPPDLRSSMLDAARYRKLAPGESLFTEGEPASHVAALGSGSIRVFRIGATGRQITLYHVRPQETSLVGMLSVLPEVAMEVAMLPVASLRVGRRQRGDAGLHLRDHDPRAGRRHLAARGRRVPQYRKPPRDERDQSRPHEQDAARGLPGAEIAERGKQTVDLRAS